MGPPACSPQIPWIRPPFGGFLHLLTDPLFCGRNLFNHRPRLPHLTSPFSRYTVRNPLAWRMSLFSWLPRPFCCPPPPIPLLYSVGVSARRKLVFAHTVALVRTEDSSLPDPIPLGPWSRNRSAFLPRASPNASRSPRRGLKHTRATHHAAPWAACACSGLTLPPRIPRRSSTVSP
jgi:hypothetical protein